MISSIQAQTAESEVRETVLAFAKGGDQQDVEALDALLHDTYRVLWHDGQKAEAIVVDKETYLSKIRSKEWGGDKRTVNIEQVQITDDANAVVKAIFIGDKADFHGYYSLINNDGTWQIVQDFVTAKFK